jgi:pimeloyl-ACP methyl ester carboxylesterase
MSNGRDVRLPGHGLTLHGLQFDGDSARTVVIVHGYLDQARSFVSLAQALCNNGERQVLALDMRGHGASDWAPTGGYYHFADYLADLSFAIDHVSPQQPVTLIGHSMGGNIATMFAGAFASRVCALVSAEGFGLLEQPVEIVSLRFQRWIQHLKSPRMRQRKVIESLQTAIEALTLNHGKVSRDVLARVASECTQPHPAGQGLTWVFDPLLQSMSPTRFDAGAFEHLAQCIEAPTLLVDGGADGMRFDGLEQRLSCYRHATRVTVEGAGHMMHWTRPAQFERAIVTFLQQIQR